jgi:hypothetical protein
MLRMTLTEGLPGRKIGNQWRFLKTALQKWLGTSPGKADCWANWAKSRTILISKTCSKTFMRAAGPKRRSADVPFDTDTLTWAHAGREGIPPQWQKSRLGPKRNIHSAHFRVQSNQAE